MIGLAILVILGIYCLLSYVLLRNPNLIGKSKNSAERRLSSLSVCMHISHRGGAGENLENTMKAFDHAAKIGTNMFELDCHITNDGYVVVAHDNNLLRMCGEDVLISDTNFRDLPPLLCTQALDFNKDFRINKNVCAAERKIILLEDLFKKYPSMPMNIDIKIDNSELVCKVAELIVKYNRENITVWGNSNQRITRNIRSANGNIATLYTVSEVLKTLLFYFVGLLPFVPVYADCFEIPMFSLFVEHMDTFPEKAGSPFLRVLMRVLDYFITNEKLISHLKKRGVSTYFFVLNAEHEWARAIACGADGIMTDFPQELKCWLERNGVRH